jgi:hypothetical protein
MYWWTAIEAGVECTNTESEIDPGFINLDIDGAAYDRVNLVSFPFYYDSIEGPNLYLDGIMNSA